MPLRDLDQVQVKQLLEDLEETGFPVGSVDILGVLNKRKSVYGARRSTLRDSFRKTYYQFKRQSIDNYREYLVLLKLSALYFPH